MNATSPSHAITSGVHHIGLTVPRLTPVVDFFVSVLGFKLLRERPDYPAAFISDGTVMLTLWQAQAEEPQAFDRKKNIGLHHLALMLRSGQNLDDVAALLAQHSEVTIEFSPETLGAGPLRHLMCLIPGGIRLELVTTGG